ncbi:MAG: glycoside hydrolase family 16 protein [Bacteroidetes bacterium]|nr:glycoside hydrolase family 16 protein [Bacteroidota bacterium]
MAFIFMLFFANCKSNGVETADKIKTPPPADSSIQIPGWDLVWNDEFNEESIDRTKWNYQTGGSGWGNNELEYYTDRKENSYIENGNLIIEAKEENYGERAYTSARLNTAHKGDWKYGMFVIRAKLPYGKGIWPAIWMMPTNSEYGGWPASGEIDIMEMLGDNFRKVYGTIHYSGSSNNHLQSGGNFSLPQSDNFVEHYHTFIAAWDPSGIQWYVDSTQYFSTAHGQPFDKEFHIILNVAVGGNWPGNPDVTTIFPQKMIVDYVRVYQRPKSER